MKDLRRIITSVTRYHVYVDAIERFVGDLLRERADSNTSGRVYRATGKNHFKDEPVTYDVFVGVLDGLKALGLVEHEKGKTRYHKIPEWGLSVTEPGRASRFWATDKLLHFAESYGIHLGNIGDHFRPEPPINPLVLRDYATGKGVNRERGPIIKDYERTRDTERLAADVRELNRFLAGCKFTGGEHYGSGLRFEVETVRSHGLSKRIKSRHPLVAACGRYTTQVHKLGWPLKIHEEDQWLVAASANPATPTRYSLVALNFHKYLQPCSSEAC